MMHDRKSIILVTVDCLRADHCGFMGYNRPTTPYLDSMADESLIFRNAIVAGAPTYYSVPAILASRYPLALGRDVLGLGPNESTLAAVAKQAGYATAAFTAANPYISARFGYARGFETFQDFMESETERVRVADAGTGSSLASRLNRGLQKMRPAMGPLRMVYDELYFRYCQRATPVTTSLDGLRRFPSADVIVDEACQWVAKSAGTPFFLWLHLMDPHSPYYPKEEALELLGSGTDHADGSALSEFLLESLGPRRSAPGKSTRADCGTLRCGDSLGRRADGASHKGTAADGSLGRLHFCANCRPRGGVPRAWRPLSSASETDGGVDPCASVDTATGIIEADREFSLQPDSPCADAAGCGAISGSSGIPRAQLQ